MLVHRCVLLFVLLFVLFVLLKLLLLELFVLLELLLVLLLLVVEHLIMLLLNVLATTVGRDDVHRATPGGSWDRG